MKLLGLFSGIGGFELGMQRAGFEVAAMCEIDPFCRKVLARHWPGVPIYEDIRELTADDLGFVPDIITGGFPCQDLSNAGPQDGLAGGRSGLWFEYLRLVGEIRPRFIVVENVAALLTGDRGGWFGTVLSGLAELGYDAEWSNISACAMGAPHVRQRLYLVAYPNGAVGEARVRHNVDGKAALFGGHCDAVLGAVSEAWLEDPSLFYGGADGAPDRLERNRAIGNAVVPQIPEMIGRAIQCRS